MGALLVSLPLAARPDWALRHLLHAQEDAGGPGERAGQTPAVGRGRRGGELGAA